MSLIETPIAPFSIAVYEHDAEACLALVQSFKNARYNLLNDRGRLLELSAARLTAYKISCNSALNTAAQIEYINSLSQQIKKLSDSVELEEIWLALLDSSTQQSSAYTSVQLAELYFGKPSEEQKLAMHIKLLKQKIFFKRDRDKFVTRTKEIVEELKKAEQVNALKLRTKQIFQEWVKSDNLSAEANIPKELESLVEKIKKFAVHAAMAPNEEKEVKDALDSVCTDHLKGISKVTPVLAYNLLEKLKIFNQCTNPAYIRSGLSDQFNSVEFDLQSDTLTRTDLRHLDCFTIDDESTMDMDDALSLEIINGGYVLGIHISDVASFIESGSKLDLALSRRLSSVYLPDKTINMFPDNLSNDHFSLKQGFDRPVLSLLVEIDHSMHIKNFKFISAVINVKKRWSYNQVDQLLEQTNSEFNTFYEIATCFEAQRIELGALQVNKHQINIKVDPQGQVTIFEEEEHGPARSIIAEMAILYNRLSAEYLSGNNFRAIFRGQEPAEQLEQLEIEEARARDYNLRVKLKPSMLAIKAEAHSSLGLKAYLQATSPIRRYFDLVNQKLLINLLNQQPPEYAEADLLSMIDSSYDTLSLITKVSKESRKYWLLRYLEQRMKKPEGNKLSAVVVKIGSKLPLVELDEVFFCSFAKSKIRVKIGDTVRVQIVAVDPKDDYLRIEIES